MTAGASSDDVTALRAWSLGADAALDLRVSPFEREIEVDDSRR